MKKEINYIEQLTAAIERLSRDDSLNPSHMSLYLALFYQWNINRFNNPISICRSDTMNISRIGAKVTYLKCLRDLHAKGFLVYTPSHNPMKGSLVEMITFSTRLNSRPTTEPTTEPSTRPTSEQVLGHVLGPSINNTNSLNNTNILNLERANENLPSSKKVKKRVVFEIPAIKDVESFFAEERSTILEAGRFYNHFQSNGWMVGGRSKMKDWKAAARNWISRSQEYNKSKPNPLHTETHKDYSEPL